MILKRTLALILSLMLLLCNMPSVTVLSTVVDNSNLSTEQSTPTTQNDPMEEGGTL